MTSARDHAVPKNQRCFETAAGNGSFVDPSVRLHAQLGFDRPLNALDSLAVTVGAHLDRLGVQRSDWQRVGRVRDAV